MYATITNPNAPTCVWMDAGVLNFKLCDRDFDCEHCPLNAALHGTDLAPARRERQRRRCVSQRDPDPRSR